MHESSSFAIGLSGVGLSSPDAFAYSLGRSLASSAASAGVGMLASQAGLGGFVSTIAASLAGRYVAGDDSRGIKEVSSVAFERNGQGFQAVNIGFDKSEFDTVVNKIKENIFNEALNNGLPTAQAVRKVQEGIEQFTQQISEEKSRVDVTAEHVENIENKLREDVTRAIGAESVQKLSAGKKFSAEDSTHVTKALSTAIKQLKKQQFHLNSQTLEPQNEIQEASIQAQNELIDEKIQQYSLLSEFSSRAQVGITRSNSADNLLHDTYIRQGQRAFGTVAGAFSGLAHEADSMSQHDYVELQRSRLPVEAQNNPEVLAKLSAGYALYKGAAKLGQGVSALDDATGNVVSGAMHKLGEDLCEMILALVKELHKTPEI